MRRDQKSARRRAHTKGKARRKADGKHKQNRKREKYFGRRNMEVPVYLLSALAGVIFLLVGVFYTQHKIHSIILFGVGMLVATIAGCMYWIDIVTPRETEVHGYLINANEQTPPNNCEPLPPEGAMLFYLGNSVFWQTKQTRYTIVRFLSPHEDLFTIRKTSEGIYLSVTIRSRDGRIVAEIIDNEFHVNPNNYYRRERPDPSSLIVYDQEGSAVLSVRYMNAATIKILGIFNSNHRPPVVIEESRQTIPPMILGGGCQRIPVGNAAITIE